MPTDVYGLEDAVKDGWLVPPRAVDVPLKFVRTGIRYDELSEEERAAWDETEWNDEGEIPDEVGAGEINRRLFNADTVDKVLQVLMERGHRVEGGDRIAKTIVFAANAKHAAFVKERFDANWPALGEAAKVITHSTERLRLSSTTSPRPCGARTSRSPWTCSTPASTCPRSPTSCCSSRCTPRPSSGR